MEAMPTDRNTFGRNLAGYLLKLAHKFKVSLEGALSDGDVESVHELRVSSRRMCELLLVLEDNLPDDDAQEVRKILRRFRRKFRTLRDLDVLGDALNDVPEAEPVACEVLIDEIRTRRARELNRVARHCGKLPLNRLVRGVKRINRDMQSEQFGYRATLALNELFDQRAEDIRKSDSLEKSGDLHPPRIAVKKMKYCAELVDRLHLRDEKELINELSGLQTILGHWNDKITGARWLAKFAGRRRNLVNRRELCAVALQMADSLLREAESDRKTVKQRWPALIDRLDQISTPGNGFQRHIRHTEITLESA